MAEGHSKRGEHYANHLLSFITCMARFIVNSCLCRILIAETIPQEDSIDMHLSGMSA